jgi:hypothetical protein
MVQRNLSDEKMVRLSMYLFRAELMRDTVHSLLDRDLANLSEADWWEFEAFLFHWLSALFVLVEGFNKLKLKDARVQKLFNAHIGHLKMVRHATYHFVLKEGPSHEQIIQQLNWAEQLHDAIGDHIKEITARKVQAEQILEKRAKSAPFNPNG